MTDVQNVKEDSFHAFLFVKDLQHFGNDLQTEFKSLRGVEWEHGLFLFPLF